MLSPIYYISFASCVKLWRIHGILSTFTTALASLFKPENHCQDLAYSMPDNSVITLSWSAKRISNRPLGILPLKLLPQPIFEGNIRFLPSLYSFNYLINIVDFLSLDATSKSDDTSVIYYALSVILLTIGMRSVKIHTFLLNIMNT